MQSLWIGARLTCLPHSHPQLISDCGTSNFIKFDYLFLILIPSLVLHTKHKVVSLSLDAIINSPNWTYDLSIGREISSIAYLRIFSLDPWLYGPIYPLTLEPSIRVIKLLPLYYTVNTPLTDSWYYSSDYLLMAWEFKNMSGVSCEMPFDFSIKKVHAES